MSFNAPTSPPSGPDGPLDADSAAAVLDVPTWLLRRWTERMEFPRNVGTPDAPCFASSEVEALRDALTTAHSVEGAVHAARERLSRYPVGDAPHAAGNRPVRP